MTKSQNQKPKEPLPLKKEVTDEEVLAAFRRIYKRHRAEFERLADR